MRIVGPVSYYRGMKHCPARTFEDLEVWRYGHALVLEVYRMTASFPKSETYGLAVQARRAAVSIPANIAEGFRKRGRPDKVRFMNIAQGSIEESRYYLILARDLGYCDPAVAFDHLERTSRLLDAYIKAILRQIAEAQHSDSRLPTP